MVVAVGVEPNTELAETSALEVDKAIGGFVANSELEARTNLYVVSFQIIALKLCLPIKEW